MKEDIVRAFQSDNFILLLTSVPENNNKPPSRFPRFSLLTSEMALQLTAPTFTKFQIYPRHFPKSLPISFLLRCPRRQTLTLTLELALNPPCRRRVTAVQASSQQQEQVEEATASDQEAGSSWGKVSAVLFDMDGVLCDSEEPSRMAAVDVFAEMGVSVTTDDFVPFMGTGNALRSLRLKSLNYSWP